LLGHLLLRRTEEGWCGGVIVETEAYLTGDPACHAFKGPTPRTRAVWNEPGHAYVYLIYGLHFCFNAVCRPAGETEAVLIRAIEPVAGLAQMEARRRAGAFQLTSGPAKLCAAMGIDLNLDNCDLCSNRSPIYIAANSDIAGARQALGPTVTTTRIGLNVARERPLRWYLEASPWVSRRAPGARASAKLRSARTNTPG
jgi:DNA-3-methyladenine glycosylase